VILSAALRARILSEARAAVPRECCGLVEGDGERVIALHPTRNLARGPDRFAVDPKDQFRLMREGRRIIGCYHSHPGGCAEPSPRDTEGASEVGFLWLIAAGDEVGAFVWEGERFARLELETA
jgi:proteasome lid subunit RPN8/RPN11